MPDFVVTRKVVVYESVLICDTTVEKLKSDLEFGDLSYKDFESHDQIIDSDSYEAQEMSSKNRGVYKL